MAMYIITAAFIALDLITGLVKAFATKSFTSTLMKTGLYHKAAIVGIIALGALVDYAQGFMDLGISIPIAGTLCVSVIAMEVGSVIENVCIINPSLIPAKLQSYFAKLNNKPNDSDIKTKDGDDSDNVQG